MSLWQHVLRRDRSGKLMPVANTVIQLDGDGLTERGESDVVLAHSPMVRVPGVRA